MAMRWRQSVRVEATIKKIEKRLPHVHVIHVGRGRYSFCHDGQVGSFYGESDGHTRGFHVRREDDHADSMTDYFPGSYCANITQMLNVVDPPPPKFSEGSLLRGKNNKRADRLGIAGRYGIVTSTSSYGCYMLLMSDTGQEERYSYERDLELISAK